MYSLPIFLCRIESDYSQENELFRYVNTSVEYNSLISRVPKDLPSVFHAKFKSSSSS